MKSGKVKTEDFHFKIKAEVVLESTDLDDLYSKAKGNIIEKMSSFQSRGSNWRFRNVKNMTIDTTAYRPLKGNSYIKLPTELENKKVIVNMKNTKDDDCFKWCVTRSLNPVGHNAERITKDLRRQAKDLDWTGLKFPVDLRQIDKFEMNNVDIVVHVFGYDKCHEIA